MDLTSCPECGVPAEVTWRFVAKSTDCPVDHVQLRCIRQHTFLGPAASLLPDRRAGQCSDHRGRSLTDKIPPS
jgi:hypothetical protein